MQKNVASTDAARKAGGDSLPDAVPFGSQITLWLRERWDIVAIACLALARSLFQHWAEHWADR